MTDTPESSLAPTAPSPPAVLAVPAAHEPPDHNTREAIGQPRDPLSALWRPSTIRARCADITRSVEDGRSGWFTLNRDALPALAHRVAGVTRQRYPDLKVPLHSRWRHFAAGGVDRKADMDARLAGRSREDILRARIDLTVISVLLDAGAGSDWHYVERPNGSTDALALPAHRQRGDDLLAMLDRAGGGVPDAAPEVTQAPEGAGAPGQGARYTRSEGLAVASFRAFMDGAFSNLAEDPMRVDARVLTRLDAAALRAVFQSGPQNPMPGLEGRAELLRRLGAALESQTRSSGLPARPSQLFDSWLGEGSTVQAAELLSTVVSHWASVWAHGSRVLGLPAGDVWPHAWAGSHTATDRSTSPDRPTGGWVPFHKLSQWLTYSLVEPLQWGGVQVLGLEALTGLPEYRNGGLLIDGGVIVPRDPRDLGRRWKAGDEWVVEWRAMTVHLLDELAQQVRKELGVSAEQMPLAAVLEGGTWAAGRELARERRGGAPPVQIDSDGTVF